MRLGLVLVALFGVGCVTTATPYQPHGFGGGYWEKRVSERAYHVSFRGNDALNSERAYEYALWRAAELTAANGFAGFSVSSDRSMNVVGSEPSLFGKGSYSTNSPSAHLTINMLTPEEIATAPKTVTVYDAKMLLDERIRETPVAPGSVPRPGPKRLPCGEPGAPC